MTANAAVRQLLIKRQFWQPYVNSDIYTVVVTSEQAAVADALTATGTLWGFGIDNVTTGGHGVPYETLNAVHRIRENYFQPYTMGSCASDTIEGPNDERPLAFPIPPGVLPQDLPAQEINNSLLQYPAITLPNVTRTEILKISGPAWENRLHWIELPQGLYNGSAIGAIVLLPMQDAKPGESASEQNILLCTLGAGWGQSTLNVTTQLFGYSNVQSAMSNPESVMREFLSAQAGEGSPSTVGISSAENLADMVSGVFLLPSYPQIQMNISTTWARYLNPFITELNTTVFHHLMQGNFTSHSPGVSAGIILPSLLANGLARIGIESSLQGELRTTTDSSGENVTDWNSWFQGKGDAFIVDSQESKDWLKLKVDTTFEGYAYNSSGVGPKVSITSLLLYCAFAIAHTCYAGISGETHLPHTNEWLTISRHLIERVG